MREYREYNDRISERANQSLAKRAAVVRTQKLIIAITGIIMISVLILLGSTIHAFANSSSKPVNKYYTSIRVEDGDTLWSIADKYNDSSMMSKQSYINEVRTLNNITEDNINSGDHIIVCYFSSEVK